MARSRIICKQVRNLTPEEFERCAELTLGYEGTMRDDLYALQEYEPEQPLNGKRVRKLWPQALLACDSGNGEILAWCLVDDEGDTQIYVDESHRRLGLGTKLMCKLLRVRSQVTVHPADEGGLAFFSTCSIPLGVRMEMNRTYMA
jgi:GNAT superfamily N-acetyltransferase